MGRYLITTSDERTWKLDRPVLFLGEWCRVYDRRKVWESLDAVVADPFGMDNEQVAHNIVYIDAVSSKLINDLSEALNVFHNTEHSIRYWQIVLGSWLQRYITTAFNRYFTLEQVLKNYDLSGTSILQTPNYSLATTDSLSFILACNDNVWNHVFYSNILGYWGYSKVELNTESIIESSGFTFDRIRPGVIKQFFLKLIEKTLSKFAKENDAFIINSYLPLKEEIELQLSLRQWPQLWRSSPSNQILPDKNLRQDFHINSSGYDGFESFIRMLLPEIIPTCYLEGYSNLTQQAALLPWITKPKFIFTSNNYDFDEVFKVWVGLKVEDGTPYFIGQHGSGFGTDIECQNWPEFKFCDRFFTWGWDGGNRKNVPAFVFKLAKRRYSRLNPKGGLLLIEALCPPRCFSSDSYFKHSIYQEEQFRFVEALPEAIQKMLIVRLYPGNEKASQWFDRLRWNERNPHINIDAGKISINKLLDQSRLVVFSNNSTGILEALALNIPTLCFWHTGLDDLLPSAKPYYELLRNVGILVDTPEQATEMISLRWDNIYEWWGDEKVQDARQSFCEQYARTVERPVRTLTKLLTTHAQQIGQ